MQRQNYTKNNQKQPKPNSSILQQLNFQLLSRTIYHLFYFFFLFLSLSLSAQAAKVKELELLRAEMDKLKQESQGIYVCARKFAYTHHRHECHSKFELLIISLNFLKFFQGEMMI